MKFLGFVNIIGIAFGLAMDAFAVALASSVVLRDVSARQYFRLAFHFGLFQALMPVIGWLAGSTVSSHIEAYDHWVAFGLLVLIGSKMIWEAVTGKHEHDGAKDPTRGLSLVTLSVATSIDALAVGVSFAMLDVVIWLPIAVIGVVAGGMTLLGLRIGSRLGERFGKRMEVLGGVVLVGIGLRILLAELL